MSYVVFCLLLEVIFLYVVKSRAVSIILIIAMVLPLPFMSLLLNAFTRETEVKLTPEYFDFGIIINGNKLEKRIELAKLESYSIQFPNNKFTSIRFWLAGGEENEFSFFRKKKEGDADTTELIENFQALIHDYNNRLRLTKQIILRPSFYASNSGLYVIIGLSVFFLAGIFFAFFYSQKSMPITFVFSSILILQLILKRKKDLDYYKRLILDAEANS